MASGPINHFMANRRGNSGDSGIGSQITAGGGCSHEIKRHLLLGRRAMTNLDSILKSRDITLLTKMCLVKTMVFSCGHVWMCELNHKESWALKNWCFWTVVLEKALESPLDCKEIKPVNLKGNKVWCWIWSSLAMWCEKLTSWKSPSFGERLKAGEGEDWGWDGWMASPTRCTWVWVSSRCWWWTGKPGVLHPWGCKELDTTEWLS